MRGFVSDHRPCTPEELAAHRAYLTQHSHVQLVVRLIDDGNPVTRAKVKGVVAIGSIKTYFRTIGSVQNSDHFTVRQAIELFTNGSHESDAGVALMRNTAANYKAQFSTPESAPKVTIVNSANDCLVVDGNKTAIAAFLHASNEGNAGFELDVYYVNAGAHTIPW